MNPRRSSRSIVCLAIIFAWASSALLGQGVPAPSPAKAEESVKLEKFIITGSLIKRVEGEGALPITTITSIEMEQRGISSIEQMLMELNINSNGLDNLASTADAVANGTVKPADWQAKVKAYSLYGLSLTCRGLKDITVIAGVKNLFNTEPRSPRCMTPAPAPAAAGSLAWPIRAAAPTRCGWTTSSAD